MSALAFATFAATLATFGAVLGVRLVRRARSKQFRGYVPEHFFDGGER